MYFDTFGTVQAGLTGINYTYEQCQAATSDHPDLNKPAPQTKGYPTLAFGIGQKYFLSQDFGVRVDIRDYIFQYEKGDGSCTPDIPVGTDIHNNITLQMGASTFF